MANDKSRRRQVEIWKYVGMVTITGSLMTILGIQKKMMNCVPYAAFIFFGFFLIFPIIAGLLFLQRNARGDHAITFQIFEKAILYYYVTVLIAMILVSGFCKSFLSPP